MNSKERVHAALAGQRVDRNPVTVLYNMLYHEDHFGELTGLPAAQANAWHHGDPEHYLALYSRMIEQAPLELLQPHSAPARAWRERMEWIERDGKHFWRDRLDGSLTPVPDPISGHGKDDVANQTQYVFDRGDVDTRLKVRSAEEMIADGSNDYVEAVVRAHGMDQFIVSGGVIGTLYNCSLHVGLTNVFAMLVEQPALIDYICHKVLEQNIEYIRMMAKAGGDAIYIDDATATRDMISVKHYERFSLPYMKAMVEEIHRLGHKAIIIYFGGIADRLEQIASIGADGLSMETSMKGYVNDVDEVARCIGDRVTLFGNVNPVDILQNAGDEDLAVEMRRQATAGRQARGFVMCTGSPITPGTPLSRVQRFIDLGKQLR